MSSLYSENEMNPSTTSVQRKYIREFNKEFVNGTELRISFDLHHCTLHYANTLRRMLSSRVPTIAFDDTWETDPKYRSIVIDKNTSGIHNEFLSHRLALVPIIMKHPNLAIQTRFDKKTSKRAFEFVHPEDVPLFKIHRKNNIETRSELDENGMLVVSSADFQVEFPEQETDGSVERRVLSAKEYFTVDPYVNDVNGYIPIDKLKRNLVNENDGEELKLVCRPTIGVGYQNARYDPTGNVAFRYKQDDEKTVEEIFQLKLEYLNNERRSKKLKDYNEDEVAQLRRSFQLLDSERVYKKNPDGTPSVFQYRIESIGFMSPLQILQTALHMMRLQLADLRHCIELGFRNQTLDIALTSKITIVSSPHQENSWIIRIQDEDHTLGNLISQELRKTFQDKYELVQYSAYKMNHPLIHNVDIVIVPKLVRNIHIQYISANYVSGKTFMGLQWSKTFIEQLPDEELYKLSSVCYFLSTLSRLIEHTNELIGEINSIGQIEPVFVNMDGDEYFSKYADL